MTTAPTYRTLRVNPLRFLVTPLPWGAFAYGLSGMLLAIPTTIFLTLFPLLPAWAWALSAVERHRVRLVGHQTIPGPPLGLRVPPWPNVPARLSSALGWREVANTLVLLLLALLTFTLWTFVLTFALTLLLAPFLPLFDRVFTIGDWSVASPMWAVAFALLGLVMVVALLYVQTLIALAQAMTTRVLTGSKIEELEHQVSALAGERIALIDAFETERRRIERDLHDGPQQHLAGAALHLGLLRNQLEAAGHHPGDKSITSLDAAHSEIERALDAIRAAVTGLRPRILIENGLPAALDDLAQRSPIPVEIAVSIESRMPVSVEASLYSIATEFIANSLKHSQASLITLHLDNRDESIRFELADDGHGGADPSRGTGLLGIEQRARLLHGTTRLDSPVGGPTTLTLTLPEEIITTGTQA